MNWQHHNTNGYRSAILSALVAGMFVVFVAAVMIRQYVGGSPAEPLRSERYRQLQAEISQDPRNQSVKDELRRLDYQLRTASFHRLALLQRGSWLAGIGAGVFLLAAGTAAVLRRKRPAPQPLAKLQSVRRAAAVSRVAVIVAAGLLGAGVGTWAMRAGGDVGGESVVTQRPAAPTVEESLPPQDEYIRHWPRFRGPAGDGVSAYVNVPGDWDGPSGRGILWKSPMSLPGESSPIVWGDRVFVTGADKDRRAIFCYSAADGSLLWQRLAPSAAGVPTVTEETGFAASIPATDGRRVYAIFASGDLVAVDFSGNLVWSKSLGVPTNPYGHATSLITHGNMVLVQYDQGTSDEKKSRLIAFNGADGKTLWTSAPREVDASWATPVAAMVGPAWQIITCANPFVTAYDLAGQELWRCECLGGEIAPSPMMAGGRVLAVNAGSMLAAIDPSGRGTVTATHLKSLAEEGLPDICSPVSDGQFIWLLETSGLLTCLRLDDGKKVWEHKLEGSFRSSPSRVGDKLYVTNDKGVTYIVAAADKFQQAAACELGEGTSCSFAFAEGRIYIRGKNNLFCVGSR